MSGMPEHLAAALKHDRNVAIKVLKPELAAVPGAERFCAGDQNDRRAESSAHAPTV
jgi:hypothetical protein